MTAENLFYEYDGNFGKQLRKAQKCIDNKSFKNLPFSEKVAFVKKNAPELKPKVSIVLKRLEDCMKFKEEGNALFKANSPFEAKDMYTKGI